MPATAPSRETGTGLAGDTLSRYEQVRHSPRHDATDRLAGGAVPPLRPSDSGVRHLWAHQADLLRDYTRRGDVPTSPSNCQLARGRRSSASCSASTAAAHSDTARVPVPELQLAAQAADKAAGYGINAIFLVGPQAGYDRADYTRSCVANAIATTNYHSVFNSTRQSRRRRSSSTTRTPARAQSPTSGR